MGSSHQLIVIFPGVVGNEVRQEFSAFILFLGGFRKISTPLTVSIVGGVFHCSDSRTPMRESLSMRQAKMMIVRKFKSNRNK
jgi:hypothetical protein